jgi:aerobic C4-dicarboxylate transport protein
MEGIARLTLHLRPPVKHITGHLYFWVLLGILAGGVLGYADPATAVQLKPLGDGFIALVKMLISPIIFCTVVLGIAGAGDMKKVGRVGGKALIYFEVVSTVALVIGLLVINLVRPGVGFNADPATLDAKSVADYAKQATTLSTTEFILDIIPVTFIDAFTGSGGLLQVLFVAILFGYAMTHMGDRAQPVQHFIEACSHIFFSMMNVLMKLAPIGAGGAMAFTIGRYGIDSLRPLAALMGSFYLTCALFILIVLGGIAAVTGFNILRFIVYIKDELLTVLGTSSSESALVPLMQKLERLGCSRSVVGLVVPSGYSFNLDGTNIYLTMAALFVAQALNIELTLGQQLTVLGVAMLTSKGASGVTGAGFITLAATLAVVPSIPVAGLALILGIDRFMSEARSLTNFIGNGVAAIVVARWENELDRAQLARELTAPASARAAAATSESASLTAD